jgi:hypothetical protein
MKKVAVIFVVGFVGLASCKKLKEYANKYGPYKVAIQGLTKAYKKATKDIKNAKKAEEVGNVFDYLAKMHNSANKTILRLRKEYSELEGLEKPEEYPEVLQEDVKEFQKVMKNFGKVATKKLKKYSNNKLVQNQVKKWMKAVKELSTKKK